VSKAPRRLALDYSCDHLKPATGYGDCRFPPSCSRFGRTVEHLLFGAAAGHRLPALVELGVTMREP